MEDKLNMIYEKLLDLEIMFKDIQYEKEKKNKEEEKRNLEYRIEDLKYIREKELERKAELMEIFRHFGELKQN